MSTTPQPDRIAGVPIEKAVCYVSEPLVNSLVREVRSLINHHTWVLGGLSAIILISNLLVVWGIWFFIHRDAKYHDKQTVAFETYTESSRQVQKDLEVRQALISERHDILLKRINLLNERVDSKQSSTPSRAVR